jgi:hypothetical protein
MDSDTQINPNWTVGELEAEFEGHDFQPVDEDKDHFTCDFCSKGVHYEAEPRVGHYVADNVVNTTHPHWIAATRPHEGEGRPMVQLASYCEDCTIRRLLFPCEGYAEVRMSFDLDEKRVMENVEITDVSPRDDGIPWDPKELSESITGIPWHKNEMMMVILGREQLFGPENMVTFFLAVGGGVDIRELIQWDGSLDPKVLGRARREYADFQRKMARDNHSRRAFSKHVRGGN